MNLLGLWYKDMKAQLKGDQQEGGPQGARKLLTLRLGAKNT
jgi:hypothetical protein